MCLGCIFKLIRQAALIFSSHLISSPKKQLRVFPKVFNYCLHLIYRTVLILPIQLICYKYQVRGKKRVKSNVLITLSLFFSDLHHCRRSVHRQSFLPAAHHRSFHHPSGSAGSLLWLLEAACCRSRSPHLPGCTQAHPFLCPMWAAFQSQLMDPQIQNGFSLISPLRKTCFLMEKKKKAETLWPADREVPSASLCFLVSSPRLSSSEEESDFTRSNTRILRERSAVTV